MRENVMAGSRILGTLRRNILIPMLEDSLKIPIIWGQEARVVIAHQNTIKMWPR